MHLTTEKVNKLIKLANADIKANIILIGEGRGSKIEDMMAKFPQLNQVFEKENIKYVNTMSLPPLLGAIGEFNLEKA